MAKDKGSLGYLAKGAIGAIAGAGILAKGVHKPSQLDEIQSIVTQILEHLSPQRSATIDELSLRKDHKLESFLSRYKYFGLRHIMGGLDISKPHAYAIFDALAKHEVIERRGSQYKTNKSKVKEFFFYGDDSGKVATKHKHKDSAYSGQSLKSGLKEFSENERDEAIDSDDDTSRIKKLLKKGDSK